MHQNFRLTLSVQTLSVLLLVTLDSKSTQFSKLCTDSWDILNFEEKQWHLLDTMWTTTVKLFGSDHLQVRVFRFCFFWPWVPWKMSWNIKGTMNQEIKGNLCPRQLSTANALAPSVKTINSSLSSIQDKSCFTKKSRDKCMRVRWRLVFNTNKKHVSGANRAGWKWIKIAEKRFCNRWEKGWVLPLSVSSHHWL